MSGTAWTLTRALGTEGEAAARSLASRSFARLSRSFSRWRLVVSARRAAASTPSRLCSSLSRSSARSAARAARSSSSSRARRRARSSRCWRSIASSSRREAA